MNYYALLFPHWGSDQSTQHSLHFAFPLSPYLYRTPSIEQLFFPFHSPHTSYSRRVRVSFFFSCCGSSSSGEAHFSVCPQVPEAKRLPLHVLGIGGGKEDVDGWQALVNTRAPVCGVPWGRRPHEGQRGMVLRVDGIELHQKKKKINNFMLLKLITLKYVIFLSFPGLVYGLIQRFDINTQHLHYYD